LRIVHQPGLEPVLDALRQEAAQLGAPALLVGGYVRDRVLGRECKDLDVVAEEGQGVALAEAVGQRLNGRAPVVFERFGTAQVSFQDFVIEFVSARAESYLPESRKPQVRPGTLAEDVIRRDFTCNTLLCDWDGEVSDLTGLGLADIEARLLRTPLDARETFAEDPLRAVRAIRFAATLDFSFHPDIPPAIAANLERLRTVVSVERVTDELRKMLLSPNPGRAIALLHETGILGAIMPEVDSMAALEQTGYHNLDVLGHTFAALELAASRPEPHLARQDELELRLGILMHDSGKPETMVRDGDHIGFVGHPELGAAKTREMLRRLHFSNEELESAARLVELHMRPIQYRAGEWSDGAVRRLVRDADRQLEELLQLAQADMLASAYPEAEGRAKLDDLRRRIGGLDAEAVRQARPPLDGHQLMVRFARPPGPWVGRVQKALLEALLDGEIPTGEGAEEAAWRWLEGHAELVQD